MRRYRADSLNLIGGFCSFIIYHGAVLVPASRLTMVNLNYVLCSFSGDPIYGLVGHHYIVFYSLMLFLASTMVRTGFHAFIKIIKWFFMMGWFYEIMNKSRWVHREDKLYDAGYKILDQRMIFRLLNSSMGTCFIKLSSIISLFNSWQLIRVLGRDFTWLQFNKLSEERCRQFPIDSGMLVRF